MEKVGTEEVMELIREHKLIRGDDMLYAVVQMTDRKECMPITREVFWRHLKKLFHDKYNEVPSNKDLTDAVDLIRAEEYTKKPVFPLTYRVNEIGGSICVNLCNEHLEYVRIDADGWEIMKDGSDYFQYDPRQEPLPRPKQSDDGWDRLKNHYNLDAKQLFMLKILLVVILHPQKVAPVSARSTTYPA